MTHEDHPSAEGATRGTGHRRLHWLRTHPKKTAAIVLVTLLAGWNALAFMHAWSMTHFASDGRSVQEAAQVESLSTWAKARLLVTGVQVARPRNEQTPADVGLAFVVHRFPATDGSECEAWHIPREKARHFCILFHGYGGRKAGLLKEAAALHAMGCATLLVDFRGSGGSSGNSTTIGYREADDVLAAVRYAAERIDDAPPILYGQSMGSAAILRAAAISQLRPRAIIIECPFDRLLSTVEHRFEAVGVPAFPSAQMLLFWGSVQQGFWAFDHNPVDFAREVTCPVLLLHGEQDPRVTLAEAESVLNNLAGPKQMIIFPGLGHGAAITGDKRLWDQAVRKFLSQLEPRTE